VNFSIYEQETWRVSAHDLVATNPVLEPMLGDEGTRTVIVARQADGTWLICGSGPSCLAHAGALIIPTSASRKIAWPTVAVYAGVAGVAGWWLWRRRAGVGSSMLMAPPELDADDSLRALVRARRRGMRIIQTPSGPRCHDGKLFRKMSECRTPTRRMVRVGVREPFPRARW